MESPRGPNTINKRLCRTARMNVTEHGSYPQHGAIHFSVKQRLFCLLSADDKCQKMIGRPEILPKISGLVLLACLFVYSPYDS